MVHTLLMLLRLACLRPCPTSLPCLPAQGLLPDVPAILLVGGGEGMGALKATVEQLDARLQGDAQVRRPRTAQTADSSSPSSNRAGDRAAAITASSHSCGSNGNSGNGNAAAAGCARGFEKQERRR